MDRSVPSGFESGKAPTDETVQNSRVSRPTSIQSPADHARVLHPDGSIGLITLARRVNGRWREERVPAEMLPEAVGLQVAYEMLSDARMPPPSYAVATGRGLALVWLHEPVPRTALPRWRTCQRHLYQALVGLGADRAALDPARVLRVVGTENCESYAGTCARMPFIVDGAIFIQPWQTNRTILRSDTERSGSSRPNVSR